MEKGKKRDRSVNFSREETEKLVSLIETKKHIIENKKSDSTIWQDKENAWRAIEKQFNSSSDRDGVYRDAKHLKLKYEALKRDTKKKVSAVRAEHCKAGGGTTAAPLTPIEEKVIEMLLLSVEGVENVSDSDQVDDHEICTNSEASSINVDVPASSNLVVEINDSNSILSIPDVNIDEPVTKKLRTSTSPIPSMSKSTLPLKSTKWDRWKTASLQMRKHPILRKRLFHRLAEEKIEVVTMQKKVIEEEMTQKALQNSLLREEILHKRNIQELEKENLLLQNEILKIQLQDLKEK